jgi:hypothetical protein
MLSGKKVLRVSIALLVAFSAAHTAERLKGHSVDQSLLQSAVLFTTERPDVAKTPGSVVPKSASLSSTVGTDLDALVGITPVAATTTSPARGECDPELGLAAVAGAMIQVLLDAPCNRGERIVVRHSGLSFAARTGPDGQAVLMLPALKTEALVAVYFQDSRLALGKVAVPEAALHARFVLIWEYPTELELRVIDGEKVLVGSNTMSAGDMQRVLALGSASVQSPVLARVYTVPGTDLGDAEITGELRITPASCGRTLRVETIYSAAGIVTREERQIAVPLCGTSGDILVLKNLASDTTLSDPK